MLRIHTLGIIMLLLFLNIPEANSDLQGKIKFYTPTVQAQIQAANDIAGPALKSIMEDVMSNAQTVVLNNGKVVKIINPKTQAQVNTDDNWSLSHDPSITPEQFDAVLREYNSPAVGVGSAIYPYAKERHIDTAYVLYIFIHESTAGTNPNWAGFKPDGSTTHNIGNIICAGYPTCYGNFRDYPSWEIGFQQAVDLLKDYRDGGPLYNGKRHADIADAIHTWAPSDDGNDPDGYSESLKRNVSKWRAANKGQFTATSEKGGDKTMVSIPTLSQAPGNKVEARFTLGGCLLDTVPNALNPSPALQDFTIQANSDWSFNENWKIVGDIPCGGVSYGGVCDMATRYHLAAKQLGLQTIYERHNGGLNGVDYDDAVVIWSNGSRGGQDLVIVNNTNKKAHFIAHIDGDDFIVNAWFEA